MNEFTFGIAVGAAICLLVLLPKLKDAEWRNENLLSDLDALEQMRERDNFFAEQESNLELAVAKAKRRFDT